MYSAWVREVSGMGKGVDKRMENVLKEFKILGLFKK